MSTHQIRALTVLQPWAACIAHLGKTVENRAWTTTYRGPVAIHAGRRYDPSVWEIRRKVGEVLQRGGNFARVRGAIIALAELIDVHRCDGSCSEWAWPDQWHFVLADTRAITPIPCRGALGLWRVPTDLAAQLIPAL